MYVGLRMITRVPTVSPDDLVLDADKIMEENKLWMLMVTEGDKLVGYIRKEDARAALPSLVSSLDKYEMNYLLTKLTVKKIIRTDLETVSPETEIEVAANLMYQKNLPGLAVVNNHNKLLGYINRSVMLEVLVDEMGLKQGGVRIAFEVEDRPGVIAEVSTIIANMGISIVSTATFFHGPRRLVVFRIKTDDPCQVKKALKKHGYRLVTPEDFVGEWE
jgi:acetoin utilization protein AcuB